MRKFKPPHAAAVQQCGGGRFEPGWEPGRVRALPVCREGRAVCGANIDDQAPVVASATSKINGHRAPGVQLRTLFAYCRCAGIKEPRPACIWDIHNNTPVADRNGTARQGGLVRSYQDYKWWKRPKHGRPEIGEWKPRRELRLLVSIALGASPYSGRPSRFAADSVSKSPRLPSGQASRPQPPLCYFST